MCHWNVSLKWWNVSPKCVYYLAKLKKYIWQNVHSTIYFILIPINTNIAHKIWADFLTLWVYYHQVFSLFDVFFVDKVNGDHSFTIYIELWEYFINFYEYILCILVFKLCVQLQCFPNVIFSHTLISSQFYISRLS